MPLCSASPPWSCWQEKPACRGEAGHGARFAADTHIERHRGDVAERTGCNGAGVPPRASRGRWQHGCSKPWPGLGLKQSPVLWGCPRRRDGVCFTNTPRMFVLRCVCGGRAAAEGLGCGEPGCALWGGQFVQGAAVWGCPGGRANLVQSGQVTPCRAVQGPAWVGFPPKTRPESPRRLLRLPDGVSSLLPCCRTSRPPRAPVPPLCPRGPPPRWQGGVGVLLPARGRGCGFWPAGLLQEGKGGSGSLRPMFPSPAGLCCVVSAQGDAEGRRCRVLFSLCRGDGPRPSPATLPERRAARCRVPAGEQPSCPCLPRAAPRHAVFNSSAAPGSPGAPGRARCGWTVVTEPRPAAVSPPWFPHVGEGFRARAGARARVTLRSGCCGCRGHDPPRPAVARSCPGGSRPPRTAAPAALPPCSEAPALPQPPPGRKIRKRFLFNLEKNSQL